MWKTAVCLTDARTFYPQANVYETGFFHSQKWERKRKIFCTGFLSTFHTRCGKVYRQELIFAVMSRRLFCRVALPFFKATSTLRMA